MSVPRHPQHFALVIAWFLLLQVISLSGQQEPAQSSFQLGDEFKQAVSLLKEGNLPSALSLVQRILAQYPAHIPSLILQGQILEDSGKLELAQRSFEQAEKIDPRSPEVLFFLGSHWFKRRNWDQATAYFERYLQIEPDNLGALVLASDSYRAKNDWVPALKYIGKAAVLAPHDARICQKYGNLLCLSGNNEEGLVWLEKAQQLDPKLKNLDFEMGKTCTLLHYNLKAIEALQRAGQRPPVSPEIDFWLGVNFEKLGEWEKARAAYSKCLQQDPANARALCGLGHALSMLKQYAEAEKYLRQALLLDPSLAEAHAHLGRLYRQLNQKEQAVREQLIFDSVSQYQGQAESKGDKVEEEKGKVWEKCIQLVKENQEEQALALLKTLPGVKTATMAKQYYSLGVIYLSLNRLADAKRTLIKARSLNPNGRGVNSTLGMVYLAGKDMGEAEKAFQAELTSHPDEEQALLGFAWLRFAEEKWEEAVTYLERSKTKASDSLLLLCDAYFHLGRTEQGLITAETLAAIAPTDQIILESLIDLLQRQNQAELVARIQKQLAKQSGTAPHN